MNLKYITCLAFFGVVGCASKAENIASTYVSPIVYSNYTCPMLAEEAARVSSRAAQAAGVQDSKASNDAVATGVGAVVFWPALFFIKGDGTTAADLARLKGEMEAIEQASIQKKCSIQFKKQTAAE